MISLEDSLALHATGEGAWRAFSDPENEAGTGMFGGWTAALLLKAVLSDARMQGEPAALNVNYVSRIPPSSELAITTRVLDQGRSIATWQAEVRVEGAEEVAATASVVAGNRRDGIGGFVEGAMPAAPDPATLQVFHPPGPFGQRIDLRPTEMRMPFNAPTTHSLSWLRDMAGHPADHVLLAYLSDCFMPRIFAKSSGFRPSSTLTMSVYFYATAAELAAVGDDYILSDVIGTRAEAAISGSQLRLWSRAGALLATSEQLAWYK